MGSSGRLAFQRGPFCVIESFLRFCRVSVRPGLRSGCSGPQRRSGRCREVAPQRAGTNPAAVRQRIDRVGRLGPCPKRLIGPRRCPAWWSRTRCQRDATSKGLLGGSVDRCNRGSSGRTGVRRVERVEELVLDEGLAQQVLRVDHDPVGLEPGSRRACRTRRWKRESTKRSSQQQAMREFLLLVEGRPERRCVLLAMSVAVSSRSRPRGTC